MVAAAENGMTVQEVAERLGVHRTIASRMLCALARHRLIARDAGGRYRVGSGVIALARQYEPVLKTAASGVLRLLADKVGATALVTVHDGDSAVAVAVVEPAAWSPVSSTARATAHRLTGAPPPTRSAPSSRRSRVSRPASRGPAGTSTPSPTARSPPGPTASRRRSRAPPASGPPASC